MLHSYHQGGKGGYYKNKVHLITSPSRMYLGIDDGCGRSIRFVLKRKRNVTN